MEQAPEAATLGALGLAGVCRETLRVIRSRPPGFRFLCGMAVTLSLSLLAHVAVYRVLFPDALMASDRGVGIRRLAAEVAEMTFLCILGFQSFASAAFCVFSVAPRYSGFAADADSVARDLQAVPRFLAKFLVSVFGSDSRLFARIVRTEPRVTMRLAVNSLGASLVVLCYAVLAAAAAAAAEAYPRWALLLIGASYLAAVAHVVMLWRVACVRSVLELEDSSGVFGALRASHQLLVGAGKFWAAAAGFTTLDSCNVAVQLAFGSLVVDDRMGLGVWLRVAVGAVLAAALWAAVVAGLVAQVVVYFVCKNSSTTTNSPADVGAPRNRKAQ